MVGFASRGLAVFLVSHETFIAASEREVAMHETIARLNIQHFRKKLAEASDELQRETLTRLLSEEEEKLAALVASSKKEKKQA